MIFLFVGAFAGSLADAQLQTQAALAERMRASIESILESIDSGVLTLDLSGRITTINRAAQTLLGGSDTSQGSVLPPIHTYVQMGGRGYQQVSMHGRMLGLLPCIVNQAAAPTL